MQKVKKTPGRYAESLSVSKNFSQPDFTDLNKGMEYLTFLTKVHI